MPDETKVEDKPPTEPPKPPADKTDYVSIANKKLEALKKLGGAGVNPFYAINHLNSALVDLKSDDAKVVTAAKATIQVVTTDGKWVPAKL